MSTLETINIERLFSESELHETLNIMYRREINKKRSSRGGDGISLNEFDKNRFLEIRKLAKELHSGSYEPKPALEFSIPKSNGKGQRIIHNPAVRDKLVQRHIASILEDVFLRAILGIQLWV